MFQDLKLGVVSAISKGSKVQENLASTKTQIRYIDKTQLFSLKIKQPHKNFSQSELNIYIKLLQKLSLQKQEQIRSFFQKMIQDTVGDFKNEESEISTEYKGKFDFMGKEKERLVNRYEVLKEREVNMCKWLEQCVDIHSKQKIRHKTFDFLKKYLKDSISRKKRIVNSHQGYKKRLMQKIFLMWKTQNSESIVAKRFSGKLEIDIYSMKTEYEEIIAKLTKKITDVENLIKTKKKTKIELVESLSKILLKSISNLSVQVASVNEVYVRNENILHKNYLEEIQQTIGSKMKELYQYKALVEKETRDDKGDENRSLTNILKKKSFKSRNERVSFSESNFLPNNNSKVQSS